MERKESSTVCALALNTIFGYEPRFSHKLIDALGSAEAVFSLTESEKREIFGPYNKYPGLINGKALEAASDEYECLVRDGVRVVSIFDEEYPPLLRECSDAPMALYVLGSSSLTEIFNARPGIAVVGTRDLSTYGREWCRRMVEAVSQAPSSPTIVSGLAIGVDVNAHLAALDHGLPTIAVLPVGIDDVYPKRHGGVADRICRTPGGALITDYPPHTAPLAVNFLRRNRIIAGMSGATLLVESRIRGGGMMTARLASGYGREVVALPGRIDDVRSEGCNLLIREKIAEPVTSLALLPEQLGLGVYRPGREKDLAETVATRMDGKLPEETVPVVVSLALEIKSTRGISLDELCRETGMDYREVALYAGLLESEGIITIDLMQRCSVNTSGQWSEG